MPVISASRRTDIPAFYTRWFMNRVRAGFCHWINPYFPGQVYRVSLAPEDCIAIVFWTRNPRPLLPYLDELDARGFKYYFSYTLLDYPRPIEPHAPGLEVALRSFRALSARIGPDFVIWRYDPILLSSATSAEYHLERFAHIAEQLAGHTRRCIYSFPTSYKKTQRNLARLNAQEGIVFDEPDAATRCNLLIEMLPIAQANGMGLYACSQEDDVPGIQQSRCIDPDLLSQVTGRPELALNPKPTRPLCGCVESVDIGAYNTCLYGCVYCYATSSLEAARQRHAVHDPDDSVLYRPETLQGVDL